MKKMLLVSSVPSLDVYSIGIISAAFTNEEVECYAFIFLENDQYSEEYQLKRYGLLPHHIERVRFLNLVENKLIKIFSARKYMKKVQEYAFQKQVEIVHFITQDIMLCGHLSLFKNYKLYYTVHDLIPHPAKLNIFQRAKHYFMRIRKDRKLVEQVKYLVTSSYHQQSKLQELYPDKIIFQHQMPSMATPMIINGKGVIAELGGITNYILFFGRIELYKGLETLYHAFLNADVGHTKLIIAGKGNIYFKRDKEREKNVLFLNRYIHDEEVTHLFSNASFLVLPYQSCTQSAVTSLAYFYNLPVIGSDIEGLRDTIINEKTGLLYPPDENDGLVNAINRLNSDEILYQDIKDYLRAEKPFFNKNQLSRDLAIIY